MAGALRGLITRAKPTLNRVKEGIKSTGKKLGDLSNESSQPTITKNPTITKESSHDKTKSGFDSKRNEMLSGMATKDSQTLIAIKQELGDIESLLSKQPALFSKMLSNSGTTSRQSNESGLIDLAADLFEGVNLAKNAGTAATVAEGAGSTIAGGAGLTALAIPAAAVAAIAGGGFLMKSAFDDVKEEREKLEKEKGLRPPETLGELWDRMKGDTTSTEIKKDEEKKQKAFEKSTNAVDKFSKKGVKALTGTSKEFIKTEKSLAQNNTELKKTTKEIKDFDVEEMFESIGDKIGGFWEDLKTGASNVMQGGKEAIQKGGQAVSETVGTAMGEGAAALGVPEAQQAKATMERSTNDLPDRSSGKSTKSGKNFDLVDAAMNYKGDKLTGLSEAQTRALVADTQRTESGGDIKAENKYGYIGKYQFGAGALADAGLVDMAKVQAAQKSKDWYKGGQTAFLNDKSNWKIEGGKDTYMNDAAMQDKAYSTYSNNHIKQGMKSGAISENDSPEKIASYVKASHLKGVGGANKLFKSGIDSTDANGTSAGKYAKDAISAIKNLTPEIESAMQNGTVKSTGSSGGEGVVGSAGGNGTITKDVANVNDLLIKGTQDAVDKGVKYHMGGKNSSEGSIDCSGWVMELNKSIATQMNDPNAIKPALDAMKTGAGQQGAAGIIQSVGSLTGKELSGSDVNEKNLKEGMVIGIDHSAKENGRYKGIDHIVQVVRNEKTGELEISESSSGKGVHKTDATSWLKRNASKEKYAVDPYASIREEKPELVASKEDKNQGIDKARQGSVADQINKPTTQNESSQPVVVNNVNNTNNSTVNSGNGDSTGVPLITRNPDSSVQNVNTSLMYHSMS